MELATPPGRFGGTPPAHWVAIDFETTGLWSPRDPETGVIEAAVVRYERDNEVGTWSTLVDPRVPLSPFIQDLTKITNEMIDAAGVPAETARHEMQEQVRGAEIVVSHNMAFDLKGFAWLGVFVPAAVRYCTMTSLVPEHVKWPRLAEALAHFGLEPIGPAHRAESDARSAGRIFLEMVRRGW